MNPPPSTHKQKRTLVPLLGAPASCASCLGRWGAHRRPRYHLDIVTTISVGTPKESVLSLARGTAVNRCFLWPPLAELCKAFPCRCHHACIASIYSTVFQLILCYHNPSLMHTHTGLLPLPSLCEGSLERVAMSQAMARHGWRRIFCRGPPPALQWRAGHVAWTTTCNISVRCHSSNSSVLRTGQD